MPFDTLPQLQTLKTDPTTNGRQNTGPKLDPAVTGLPSGANIDGTGKRVVLSSTAIIDNYELDDYDILVQPGAAGSEFNDCNIAHTNGKIVNNFFQIDIYGDVNFNWCNFVGDGRGDGYGVFEKLRDTAIETNYFGCRLWHYASDSIKPWRGSIKQCYFDPPITHPRTSQVWSAAATYNTDDCVIESTSSQGFIFIALQNGVTSQPDFAGRTSSADWQYANPHGDNITIGEVFGGLVIEDTFIEANPVNKYHATLGGTSVNNGLRLGGGGQTRSFDQLTVRNVAIGYDQISNSVPVHEAYTGGNFTRPIFDNVWIEPSNSGSYTYQDSGRFQWGTVRDLNTNSIVPLPTNSIVYDSPSTTRNAIMMPGGRPLIVGGQVLYVQ